jgi:hypothetical protein
MSRNVCSSRSRCRRLIGRTTLFAFPLAVSTGSLTAQSTIPFQPDLVLTYVMRNLSDTADREFNSTIVQVPPEQTEFAVDMQYTPPAWRTCGSITSAGMLSLIPCRRYQLERVFHAGVETKLLGLTIPMLGTKKELGDHWRMVETEPKGYNCGT